MLKSIPLFLLKQFLFCRTVELSTNRNISYLSVGRMVIVELIALLRYFKTYAYIKNVVDMNMS